MQHTSQPSPLDVVERQLRTYNARDIEGFAACFAQGVQVHDLETGTLRCEGLAALRERYGAQFREHPRQRSTVLTRHVVGDYVTDLEFITGTVGRPDAHLLAIYRVRDGLIDRAWFTPRVGTGAA